MINYRVDDLDGLLEELKKGRVEIDPHREDYDYGRFAWIVDPKGNRIELWEPPKEMLANTSVTLRALFSSRLAAHARFRPALVSRALALESRFGFQQVMNRD